MHQYATPLNTLLHSSSLEWWWMARAFLFQFWTILTLLLDLPASHCSPRVVFCVSFYSAQNRIVKRMPIFPTNSSYMSLWFAIPTVQVFESAVLWHVVIITSKTRLNSFLFIPSTPVVVSHSLSRSRRAHSWNCWLVDQLFPWLMQFPQRISTWGFCLLEAFSELICFSSRKKIDLEELLQEMFQKHSVLNTFLKRHCKRALSLVLFMFVKMKPLSYDDRLWLVVVS